MFTDDILLNFCTSFSSKSVNMAEPIKPNGISTMLAKRELQHLEQEKYKRVPEEVRSTTLARLLVYCVLHTGQDFISRSELSIMFWFDIKQSSQACLILCYRIRQNQKIIF